MKQIHVHSVEKEGKRRRAKMKRSSTQMLLVISTMSTLSVHSHMELLAQNTHRIDAFLSLSLSFVGRQKATHAVSL